MYVLDYLLYHLRPYGISLNSHKLTSIQPTASSSPPTQSIFITDATEAGNDVAETAAASTLNDKRITKEPNRNLVSASNASSNRRKLRSSHNQNETKSHNVTRSNPSD